jgi:hypothetical protein
VIEGVSINSQPEVLEHMKAWAIEQLLKFQQFLAPRIRALDLTAAPDSEIERSEYEAQL